MTFERALPADLVAMVCALGLLFVIGIDWYSTTAGGEARRIERSTTVQGAQGGEVSRAVDERALEAAEDAERNAIQLTGALDRVILAGLVATVVLALAAGFLRAAGRRFEPPLTPSAAAAVCACVTAMLVVGRMIQEPGPDALTTVESGAPLAVAVLGAIALACAVAVRAEEAGTAWRGPAGLAEREADDGRPGGGPGRGADEGDVGGAPV